MTDSESFSIETQRQIDKLSGSSVRLTLMSVSASTLPDTFLEWAAFTSATPHDVVGRLSDGSFGVFSLRSIGAEGTAGIEHRFLLNLQKTLSPIARRRQIGTIRFRSVHRWACELNGALDLFNNLFDAPAILLPMHCSHLPIPVEVPTYMPLHHIAAPAFLLGPHSVNGADHALEAKARANG
jgi:hypothetical protein